MTKSLSLNQLQKTAFLKEEGVTTGVQEGMRVTAWGSIC